MPNRPRSLFFDTVVLSNFAFANEGVPFLKKKYGRRGRIPFQVYQEITKAIYGGYEKLSSVTELLISKNGFQKISLTDKEKADYLPLLKNIGEGEASCISAAYHQKAVVVTDDRTARNVCFEKKILVTGTIGILKSACLESSLTVFEADAMLEQMIEHGYYSPIKRIRDII